MEYETGSPAGLMEIRNAYNILVGKTEGKRPLGRPRCRREDILKWILGKPNESGEWINLAHDRDR
jgi:hypothetical protein